MDSTLPFNETDRTNQEIHPSSPGEAPKRKRQQTKPPTVKEIGHINQHIEIQEAHKLGSSDAISTNEIGESSRRTRRPAKPPTNSKLRGESVGRKRRATNPPTNAQKKSKSNGKRRRRFPAINELVDCQHCRALMWQAESTNKTKDKSKLTFSLCCHAGRVSLPRVKKTPQFLDVLLKTSATFRQNIRRVNSAFAFTSTGAKVDESINNKPGPYTYRVHGQNCHRLGSLLPTPGEQPKYSQMYIFDTANEVKNRIRSLTGSISSTSLDEKVVSGLKEMLDSTNDLTKIYRSARDRYESGKPTDLTIRLVGQRHRGKQYDLPRSEEIAGLIVGDLSSTTGARDIILELQSNDLQRISELHPLYMALQYPLLFPYGEDGYHVIFHTQLQIRRLSKGNVSPCLSIMLIKSKQDYLKV
ncbi:unnamed protein product [Arabidopsis thaliana]|uniref:Helitron helicase-like domain-containing protein n=1 Tax=Arabidopsis thaliana TaxID=3702 RepID=A0A5S9YD64_ARATH|nr:unnamed protein product [Arabidopsis thaliana]